MHPVCITINQANETFFATLFRIRCIFEKAAMLILEYANYVDKLYRQIISTNYANKIAPMLLLLTVSGVRH